jgi:hypothetical protein
MSPLHRDHFISGPYTLKGGKLTFRAEHLTFYDARLAKEAGRDFTIHLSGPDGLQAFAGKVLSSKLVEGTKPARWEITMRVTP